MCSSDLYLVLTEAQTAQRLIRPEVRRFVAEDATGAGLWRSDGTAAGTKLVKRSPKGYPAGLVVAGEGFRAGARRPVSPVLRQPLASVSSQRFLIHGRWAGPQVDKITPLGDDPEPARTTPASPA